MTKPKPFPVWVSAVERVLDKTPANLDQVAAGFWTKLRLSVFSSFQWFSKPGTAQRKKICERSQFFCCLPCRWSDLTDFVLLRDWTTGILVAVVSLIVSAVLDTLLKTAQGGSQNISCWGGLLVPFQTVSGGRVGGGWLSHFSRPVQVVALVYLGGLGGLVRPHCPLRPNSSSGSGGRLVWTTRFVAAQSKRWLWWAGVRSHRVGEAWIASKRTVFRSGAERFHDCPCL